MNDRLEKQFFMNCKLTPLKMDEADVVTFIESNNVELLIVATLLYGLNLKSVYKKLSQGKRKEIGFMLSPFILFYTLAISKSVKEMAIGNMEKTALEKEISQVKNYQLLLVLSELLTTIQVENYPEIKEKFQRNHVLIENAVAFHKVQVMELIYKTPQV